MSDIALLFPGQGSQKPGMGADLNESSGCYRAMLAKADETLGFSLSKVMLEGTEEELKETKIAQLAVFTMSCALLAELEIDHSRVACVAGHSLGEYSALVAAGALTFEDGLRLVQIRATLMAEAAEGRQGTMAAVLGLSGEQVAAAISDIQDAVIANYNSPEQTVISGTPEAIDQAGQALKAAGAKRVVPLAVSGAFHSPLMQPAASRFAETLGSADLTDPKIPVIANSSARKLTRATEIGEELAVQITSSVEWVSTLNAAADMGASSFVEIGPGKVLSGLVKRTLSGTSSINIETLADLDALNNSDISPAIRRNYVHA